MLDHLIGSDAQHILWWQMSIRAVLIFLFGLTVIRLFGRHAFGKQTPLDIVLAIVIGSTFSRALTGNARFIPTLVAMFVLVLCFWLFSHVAARWPPFGRLVKGEPVSLVHEGRLDDGRMRWTGVSERDIEEAARQSGLSGLSDVREAVLERSGKISTIREHEGTGR